MQKLFAKIFKAQRKSTLIKLSQKASAQDLYARIKLDLKKETKRATEVTMPTIIALFKESGDKTFDLLEQEQRMRITDEIHDYLTTQVKFFTEAITDTTNAAMLRIVEDSLSSSESVGEIKDRLAQYFTEAEVYRAVHIVTGKQIGRAHV